MILIEKEGKEDLEPDGVLQDTVSCPLLFLLHSFINSDLWNSDVKCYVDDTTTVFGSFVIIGKVP